MKNAFKTGFIAMIIAIGAAACSGGNSGRPGDSTRMDSSTMADTSQTGNAPGANGSTAPIDSGLDKSGSGGTDSTKM